MILCSTKFVFIITKKQQIIVTSVCYLQLGFAIALSNFTCSFFNKINFQSFAWLHELY